MLWKENNKKKNIIIIGLIVLLILIGIIISIMFIISKDNAIEDQDFAEYLKNNSTEMYELKEDTKIDLSNITLLNDKEIMLMNCKLIFVGNYAPSDYKITIRNENTRSTLDFKAVEFDLSKLNNGIFELQAGLNFVYNKKDESIKISKGDEWTAIMKNEVLDHSQEDELTRYDITTTENFIQKFNSDTTNFSVKQNMTLNLSDLNINKSIIINNEENELILTGTLIANDNGEIRIEGNGKVDLSNLEIIYNNNEDVDMQKEIIHIAKSYKNIIGEPKLSKGVKFWIDDEGNNAYVAYFYTNVATLKDVVYNEIKDFLEGKTDKTSYPIEEDQVKDSITINLDNPKITRDINIYFNKSIKLILTGSVTFDGGSYSFEGTGNVDITKLKINATPEVGKTKTNDILWYETGKINFQYNGNYETVINGKRTVLRYN